MDNKLTAQTIALILVLFLFSKPDPFDSLHDFLEHAFMVILFIHYGRKAGYKSLAEAFSDSIPAFLIRYLLGK